jgi:hypothetical protein
VLGKLTCMSGATACIGRVDALRGEASTRRLGTLRSDQEPRKWLAAASGPWFTKLDGSQPDAWRYSVESEPDKGAEVADHR